MHVASMRLELRLADCRTSGQRRRLLEAMIPTLRRHFNVALAEVDGPADTCLAAAAVDENRRDARDTLKKVADAVAAHPRVVVVSRAIHDL